MQQRVNDKTARVIQKRHPEPNLQMREKVEESDAPTRDRNPLGNVTCKIGDNACAAKHVSAIQRTGILHPMSKSQRVQSLTKLQRQYGNRFVQRVIAQNSIQTKLKIGQPGDIYEHQADRVAEKMMQMPEPQMQRQPEEEEEEELQMVQRQVEDEEEEPVCGVQEKLTMGSPGDVYEQEADRVAEAISSEGGLSDLTSMTSIQQELLSSVDPRILGGLTGRTIGPIVSTDSVGSRRLSVNRKQELPLHKDGSISVNTERRILQSKGSGSRLSPQMNSYMGIQTGYDFSNVRVKSDSEAAALNQNLGARAFTNGSDIWLGKGEKATDVKLMGHELTHVAQQGAANRLQPQSNAFSQLLASKGYMPKFMQALTKNANGNSSLFQKGILQFINKYPSSQMNTLQAQILDGAKSDSINRRESAQTLRGSIPGCQGSSFCECTPTSASIKNVKKFTKGKLYGHKFDFVVDLTYSKGATKHKDCDLEWWEKTTRPPAWQTVIKKNTWNDMFALYPTSPVFDGWTKNRKKPCPGKETAKLHDPPAASVDLPARTLWFNLKVKGGGTTKSATGKQVLEPDGKGGIKTQTFTVP